MSSIALELPLLFAADDSTSTSWGLLIVGLIVGAVIAFFVNLLQGRDAKSQSKRLLEQTKVDCENLIKTAELEKKEKLLQLLIDEMCSHVEILY